MIGMSVRKGEIAFSPPLLPVPTRPSRPPPSLSHSLPDDLFIFCFFFTHHGYFGCSSEMFRIRTTRVFPEFDFLRKQAAALSLTSGILKKKKRKRGEKNKTLDDIAVL